MVEFMQGGLAVAIVGYLIVEKVRVWRLLARIERLEAEARRSGWRIPHD